MADDLAHKLARWLVEGPEYPISSTFYDVHDKPLLPPKSVLEVLPQVWRETDHNNISLLADYERDLAECLGYDSWADVLAAAKD